MTLAIAAIFRDEARYLKEWICFHQIVGVSRFYLFNNFSEDDYLPVLQPFIDRGDVILKDWPHMPGLMQSYHDLMHSYQTLEEWIAFIDIDEFLFSPIYLTISEAIAAINPRGSSVAVNWMLFGSSREEHYREGLVTERFTWRPDANFLMPLPSCGPGLYAGNRHVKCIVRSSEFESVGSNPHYFNTRRGTYTENNEELTPGQPWVSPYTSHRILRLNHYRTKSRDEFVSRIRYRADAIPPGDPAEFDWYQAQDVDDREIHRFLPELKRRVAE